jgi:hypothetical protein
LNRSRSPGGGRYLEGVGWTVGLDRLVLALEGAAKSALLSPVLAGNGQDRMEVRATRPGKEGLAMSALQGTVKGGQVVLDDPNSLPEGTRVEVLPVGAGRPERRDEDEGPPTAEEIASVLALMDQFESGWLSPEDDAAWRAALREEREREKGRFFEDADKLRRMWE